MRNWALLALLSISLAFAFASGSQDITRRSVLNSRALNSTKGTTEVQWDNYSLLLRGQRIFLHSGEFHTFRLPVPSLWPDILQKIKAAGLNGISVYIHAGLLNPSRNVTDLDGFRALEPLWEAASAAGIWIVLRPGPYINAETTAGGLPHWMTTEVSGALRTNATDYFEAWQAYIGAIISATEPYQITKGGPVIAVQIDNEFSANPISEAYFAELEEKYLEGGIVVPLTYNDPGEGKNFINGTGAPDLYGLDAYPQGFDCSNPEKWSPVQLYYSYHEQTDQRQPFYFPEFQGGAFDPWGPTAPGYANCAELTGATFESVFYRGLWASNAKMLSFYMVYGGTSWGALPYHGVYTSYDYGAAISENRNLSTTKYAELKRQGIFLRSSPSFYKTDYINDSYSDVGITNNPAVYATLLKNPDDAAGFLIVRQNDSTSTSTVTFNTTLTTSLGAISIPQVVPSITIDGRESKLVVTDYAFGQSSSVLYSTAQVLFAGVIGERDVLFLYGAKNQTHEVSLKLTGTPTVQIKSADVGFTTSNSTAASANQTVVSFLAGIEGFITVYDSSTQLILYADEDTAGTWWNPVIPAASGDFPHFWQLGTNSSVLVGGPYLVRNATISGSTLTLVGDLETSGRLFVVAPPTVNQITWNGESVEANATLSNDAVWVGEVNTKTLSVTVPSLTGWKYSDSLPEILGNYSDSAWAVANHTTTNIPDKPYYGDGRILYGCDYGFCENIVVWRGHFNATGAEKTMNLSINGGEAFAASVWVNDVFLNTSYGNSTNDKNVIEETDEVFYFPSGSLIAGKDNVVTIVQDNMGLNETGSDDACKAPRGLRGWKLDSGNFSEWKVQGKLGGYENYPDKTRGVFNEGGLYGERAGWHLPGFDTSEWTTRDLSEGLPNSAAGVGFFVTTFNLSLPSYQDVFLSFTFDDNVGTPGTLYRALLFVNGWHQGKRVGNLGPQAKFPVHQGILNYSGENTVAVALWAMQSNVTIQPTLALTVDGVVEGGVGGVVTNNPTWTARNAY